MTYSVPATINEANYPFIGNPNKPFYASRNLPVLLFVNHITVGLTDLVGPDSSIENTISWAKTAAGTSWHGGVDSDSIRNTLPDSYTAWHAGVKGHSFNSPTIGLEVGLHDVDWTKLPKDHLEATIRNMAIFWAPRVIKFNMPVRYEFDRDRIDYMIARRERIGFTDHKILNPATRRDPGWTSLTTNTFPVSLFLNNVKEEVAKRGSGVPSGPTPTPLPSVWTPLVRDGKMGPATIKRWQAVMGTVQDGSISYPESSLVAAVQRFLNTEGARLTVDGKGILPNLSRDQGPSNTIRALQRHLGTTVDGILSHPTSAAVSALQGRLNKAKVGSKRF